MWITTSKVLPIIMLVVIPFLASILGIILSDLFPLSPSQIGFSLLTPSVAGFIYLFSIIYLVSISSLVYGFYPIKFRIIEKRGFSNLLTEQAYVKNILYVEIPILIPVPQLLCLSSDFIQVLTYT